MEQRIELVPNCSLTPRGRQTFLRRYLPVFFELCPIFRPAGILAGFIVLGFGDAGPWDSLARQHAAAKLHPDGVDYRFLDHLVTRSRHGEAKQEFARHWAKVKLRSPPRRLGTSRLTIESHGRAYEVGSFLTEEDRRLLAERLGRLVGGVNESPPLVREIGDPFR